MMKNEEALKLKNQLCFPLYAASRQIIRLYKPYLDPLGLTYTQYLVMLVLWEDKTVTVKALGDRLSLDSGTLTPLLKKLESAHLIHRERSQTDERSVIVRLSENGENLKQECIDIPFKVGNCLKMSQEDLKELHRLLYKILNNDNFTCE